MARQRFPTLQPGPDARETTGLTKGSRRPSAVMIFFALGASLTVLSLEAVSPLAAGLGVSLAALCGANGVAGLAAAFFAAEVVFCAPCLGCVATGRTAILVGAGLLGAICAVLLSFLSAEAAGFAAVRSEEHTSELQSQFHLVCRLLLEKKKKKINNTS